jgi:peptidoglycan-associated lipoprotein
VTVQGRLVPDLKAKELAAELDDRAARMKPCVDAARKLLDERGVLNKTAEAAALQAQAQYFARYPQITFTIEGHADERGTREYNIALGEKRATPAKNFLVSLGVNPARIAVVSYGKESPVALGSDEESWARNRRAASVIIN